MSGYIDAHVHVWTDDTATYPLGAGWNKSDMNPPVFTAADLFKHMKPAGVERVNLIQMSYYYPKDLPGRTGGNFDNSYMLDVIAKHKDVFVGTAVIDPLGKEPAREMAALGKRGVRAFRIHPALGRQKAEKWLTPPGYDAMFREGARANQAMSCLIEPSCLPELDRLCLTHPETPVIIDHLCRIGMDGVIRDADVKILCDMARHKKILVKVGAFYAFGKKDPPYTDLVPLIRKVIKAYGVERCMWESDCPFQVQGKHTYAASIDLVKKKLDFLSDADRDWLLRKTAEKFFFRS